MNIKENKDLTYPELMQKASQAGSPRDLLEQSERKGLLKGIITGVITTSLVVSIIAKFSE